jgi:hypothetical protein
MSVVRSLYATQSLTSPLLDAPAGGNLAVGSSAANVSIGGLTTTTTILGDSVINGNLIVYGTTTIIDTVSVSTTGSYTYVNAGYTATVAQTGGMVDIYLPTATTGAVAGAWTPGVTGVSNPSVVIATAGVFSLGDIISISGAHTPANNGLFEVLSNVGATLFIRGTGNVTNVEDFTNDQFVADPNPSGTITKVNVSIIRNGLDGNWQAGKGAVTGITFAPFMVTGAAFHNTLLGLAAGDDHTQYALLAGRGAGQVLYGGTTAGASLTLRSTSDAAKGDLILDGSVKVFSDIDTVGANALSLGAGNATRLILGSDTCPVQGAGLPLQSIKTTTTGTNLAPTLAQLVPFTILTNNASFTYTLPVGLPAYDGMTIRFMNTGTGTKTIIAGGSQLIDGTSTLALVGGGRIVLVYVNASPGNWYTF